MLLSSLDALGKTEIGLWSIYVSGIHIYIFFCIDVSKTLRITFDDISLKAYTKHWSIVLHISSEHRKGRHCSSHGN